MNTEMIYAIYCEETNAVKIGISSDVKKRLSGLQTSNASALELLGYVEMPNARYYERGIHERLRDYRLKGEWFAYTDKVTAICDLIINKEAEVLRMIIPKPKEPLKIELPVIPKHLVKSYNLAKKYQDMELIRSSLRGKNLILCGL